MTQNFYPMTENTFKIFSIFLTTHDVQHRNIFQMREKAYKQVPKLRNTNKFLSCYNMLQLERVSKIILFFFKDYVRQSQIYDTSVQVFSTFQLSINYNLSTFISIFFHHIQEYTTKRYKEQYHLLNAPQLN